MEILESTKTKYVFRFLLYLVSLLCILTMAYLSDLEGFLFIPFFIISIIYIIKDILFVSRGTKLLSIESKSNKLLWILSSSLLMIILGNVFDNDAALKTLIFVLILVNGIINEYRQKVLIVNHDSIEQIGFPFSTRIKWEDIDNVINDENSLSIQAKNKDYIYIDLTKSTQNEKLSLDLILKNIVHKP